ncbi:MAG: exodeoxyribonuclease VII large subunit, partial [Clostridia bacterium]|nr:exodeoxyribonuclease VII large subunit [Clostridia bacterium]
TAPTGAAIQDIRNITYRRNPYIEIILYPALVQGDAAKASIVRGIEALDDLGVDVMIVGRGGGSIEDLWAFNEEDVARAIFNCKTPVISAVGHETDVTIADYVADLRAPTPSAAAELAVFDFKVLEEQIQGYGKRLDYVMNNRLMIQKQRLEHYRTKLGYLSPENLINDKRMYLIKQEERLQLLMEQTIMKKRHSLGLYIERMKGLSPLNKLNQGFSYVEREDHKAVTKVDQVEEGELLCIHVSDGRIWSRTEKKEEGVKEWQRK